MIKIVNYMIYILYTYIMIIIMNTLYITSLSHYDNKPFNDTIHEFPEILTLQTETCINTT